MLINIIMSNDSANTLSNKNENKLNKMSKNSEIKDTNETATESISVKTEIESDDEMDSEDNPYTDYIHIKDEVLEDDGEHHQSVDSCSGYKDIPGQSQLEDMNHSRSKENTETDMVYEVKLEPVEELYDDHDVKKDIAIGPIGLHANTNATQEENEDNQTNSKASEQNQHSNDNNVPVVKLEKDMMYEVKLEPMENENDMPLSKKARSKTKAENTNRRYSLEFKKRNSIDEHQALKCAEEKSQKFTARFYTRHIKKRNINNNNLKGTGNITLHANIEEDIFINCIQCSYQTVTKSSLDRHLKLHDPSRPFECNECGYRYKNKVNLQTHLMNVHSLEKNYNCGYCDYKTNSSSHIIMHIKTHNGDKPFSCSKCNFKSTRQCDVREHFKIHENKKSFACSLCKLKFVRKGNLSAHLRTHTGEKPFSCKLCSYKSARKYDMTKHVRTHHTGEKPYACSLCSYRSARKDLLKSHWNYNHT